MRTDMTRTTTATAAASAFVIGLLTTAAAAQGRLEPERLYNGIDRSFPVEISGTGDGELTVRLMSPGVDSPAATASVESGSNDLAELFPSLWESGATSFYWAQLFEGETPVGPPVVLQPMSGPTRAARTQSGLQFRPAAPGSAGYRVYVEQEAVMETSMGDIRLRMRPDAAPNTAYNFMHLAGGGFYTDIIFHRIIERNPQGNPFVIQVGDPTGTGRGGPGYNIDLEPTTLPHSFGVLSMARSGDPDSNGSQVFICLSRAGTDFLDNNYTAFGEVIGGGDVVIALSRVEVEGDRPIDPPVLRTIRLVDAAPYGTGPDAATREDTLGSDE